MNLRYLTNLLKQCLLQTTTEAMVAAHMLNSIMVVTLFLSCLSIVYGMLMAKSTFEGILKQRPEKRPFVLTRSNYLGGQKCVFVHLFVFAILSIIDMVLPGQAIINRPGSILGCPYL